MEITSEPMIPVLKNAMLTLHTCCKLHYPDCAGCQLAKEIKFGEENIPLCRCNGTPAEWCVIGEITAAAVVGWQWGMYTVGMMGG